MMTLLFLCGPETRYPSPAVPMLRKLRLRGLATRSKCEAEGVASGDGALSPLNLRLLRIGTRYPNNENEKIPVLSFKQRAIRASKIEVRIALYITRTSYSAALYRS